jgi:hypothetical protein
MTAGDPIRFRGALKGWPKLTGFPDPPPTLDDAEAAFQRGVDAYARGAGVEAREEFLRAASLIPEDVPEAYAASFDALRRIAGENAVLAGGGGGG